MADYNHAETMDRMCDAFRTFAMLAAVVSPEDLHEARRAVQVADAVGFVVDPTKYREALASGGLDRQRKLIDLFDQTFARLKALFPNDPYFRLVDLANGEARGTATAGLGRGPR